MMAVILPLLRMPVTLFSTRFLLPLSTRPSLLNSMSMRRSPLSFRCGSRSTLESFFVNFSGSFVFWLRE